MGAVLLLLSFVVILVKLFKKRKKLVLILRARNRDYIIEKKKSDKLTRAKSIFFSNVSHELRTPLYGIIGISSHLLEKDTIKEHRDDVKSLKYSADYLLALINDVLNLNKLEEIDN